MKFQAVVYSTVVTLSWCSLSGKIPNSAQAYSLYPETPSLNLPNSKAQDRESHTLVKPEKIEQETQSSALEDGQEIFIEDDTSYQQYSDQVESAIKDGTKIYYSQKQFIFDDQVNSYAVQTIITPDGSQLSILEKTSGDKGPQKAAGMIYRDFNPATDFTKAVKPSSTQIKSQAASEESVEKLEPILTSLEVIFKQGIEGRITEKILLPANASRTEITEVLRPFIDRHWLTPLQAQGWVGTEIFLNLQEARKHPENFLDGQTSSISKEIPLPNNLGASIYEGTSISTVEQSQKKANVALFALISVDREKTDTSPNPERGIQTALTYAREHQLSNLNRQKLTSPYTNLIRNARNLEDLTNIFNQAGHGHGIQLNLNQQKERQWLYTSADRKSPYYIGKVYGKEPTQAQIQTALHIKEWLRASGIQYVQNKLGLDTQDKLADALETRIQGMHPDIARGVAEYLTHKVANPHCHENGFCSDLDIQTQSSLLLRGVAKKPESPNPVFPPVISQKQVFYPGGKKIFPPAAPPFMGGGSSGGDSFPSLPPTGSQDSPQQSPLPPPTPPTPPTPTPPPSKIPESSPVLGLLIVSSFLGAGKLIGKKINVRAKF